MRYILQRYNKVFLPQIKKELDVWNQAWCRHRMRTTKSTPYQMWIAGQYQNPVGLSIAHEDIVMYGVEEVIDNDSRPVFEVPQVIDESCLQKLFDQVPSDIFQIIIVSMRTEHQLMSLRSMHLTFAIRNLNIVVIYFLRLQWKSFVSYEP